MIYSSSVRCLIILLVTILTLGILWVEVLGTVIRYMSLFSIVETPIRSVGSTILHRGDIRIH